MSYINIQYIGEEILAIDERAIGPLTYGLCTCYASRNRIHERTISLRSLGIIFRVLRLEVFIYNVYITNQFQTIFAKGGG